MEATAASERVDRSGVLEHPLGRVPERRPSERFQRSPGDVACNRFVEGKADRRLPPLGIDSPAFQPVGDQGLFQGESGGLE
jgi:hypothetical protein